MATHYTNKKWNELYNTIVTNKYSAFSLFDFNLSRGYLFKNNDIISLNDVSKMILITY
jgi:hypothetical protein